MNLKHVFIALLVLFATNADAQIVQDTFFGDNIVQQNVISRPRVVRKVVRNNDKIVNNNTYIINEAPAVVAPAPVVVPRPRVYYVTPGYYYYPPGSFY